MTHSHQPHSNPSIDPNQPFDPIQAVDPNQPLTKPDESTADILLVALMILFALTGFILLGVF